MRMIPIRCLLISAVSTTLLVAGVPAIAQDTIQTQPETAQPDQAPPPPPPMASESTTGNMAPPPPDGINKTYPVCRGGMTDNCQNPGEGGAPGRSRASDVKGGAPAHHKMHRRHS
jgi:hypothetical protein